MTYVDGMMAPVRAADREAFCAGSRAMAGVFREHGALSVVDCWGDDVPEGKLNSMRSAVLLEPGEVVVFSWVTWPSKAVRDAGWAALRDDPRMAELGPAIPMDGKRLILGGFEMVVAE